MELILSFYDTSEKVKSKIKKGDSTQHFQFHLMVVDWKGVSEVKLIENNENYLHFKKLDELTGIVTLVENGTSLLHKFTYKNMKELTNSFSLYRLGVSEYKETLHFITPEEYEELSTNSNEKVTFLGSFNEQRLLEMDLEKSAERNTNKAVVIGVIIAVIAVVRLIMAVA